MQGQVQAWPCPGECLISDRSQKGCRCEQSMFGEQDAFYLGGLMSVKNFFSQLRSQGPSPFATYR